jgi:hypothetical protein
MRAVGEDEIIIMGYMVPAIRCLNIDRIENEYALTGFLYYSFWVCGDQSVHIYMYSMSGTNLRGEVQMELGRLVYYLSIF